VFGSDNGLARGRVTTLLADREQSLWIGIEGGGLNRLRSGSFVSYGPDEGLPGVPVLTVYGDIYNDLWIGTEGAGLVNLRGGMARRYTTRDGLSSNTVTSVYGEQNRVWVGTLGGGLNLFEHGRFEHFGTADGLPSDAVTALFSSPGGTLWIATDAGLARFDGRSFDVLTTRDGLASSYVTTVHAGSAGDVWIGTYDAGLNHYRDGSFISYTTADGLGSDAVLTLHEDNDHVLWIGTYGGGLTRFRDGRMTTFTSSDGLFSDVIFQILEDSRNNLWFTSSKGIFYVPKWVLEDFAAGRVDEILSVSFGRGEGLASYEMSGGFQPAGWRSVDGNLWFPTAQGVVSVNPEELRTNSVPPSPVIELILVDGQPVTRSGMSTIDIAPGGRRLDIEFAGLSFVAPENMSYRYKLEGYDREWQEGGSDRTATYTNLDPGTYTFKLYSANADGIWSKVTASVTLNFRPFFYQTQWFWMTALAGLVLIAFLLYRLRVRALTLRQRELEEIVENRTHDLREAKEQIEAHVTSLRDLDRFRARFFSNISHEFRTPLTLMIGPLENALTGAYGPVKGLLRVQMELMLRNSRRLLRLINQLLDVAKIESGRMALRAQERNIVTFAEGVVFSFTGFSVERGIDLQFSSEDDVVDVLFDAEKIEKVLFNVLSNAMKFTPSGGSVSVSITRRVDASQADQGWVDVMISDTGPGIPDDEVSRIFDRYHQVDGAVSQVQEGTGIGLSLAKELVELHRGTIRAENRTGDGAAFIISLRLGSDHLSADEIVDDSADSEDDFVHASMASMTEMVVADPAEVDDASSGEEVTEEIPPDAPVVLVVDDNRDVRQYVRACLQPRYRVVESADGESALRLLAEVDPDVILSDLMMPRMDGNELARRIKEDERFSHIPIILLTAKASDDLKVEGLEMGVDEYMSKPFNARELHARLRNLVKIRQQERELKTLNQDLEHRVQGQLQVILKERERYEHELITARDKAEESARLKSSILDNMSHEIRTPLTAILGYAQLLGDEVGSEHEEFVQFIERSGKRLLDTLSSILDLSQLESEGIRLEPVDLDVSEAVQSAIALFVPMARRKGIQVLAHTPDDPLIVRHDATAFDRILHNLIGNAVKFTDEGQITVSVVPCSDMFELHVDDSGIGIGEEFLPDLFEAFKQESTGVSRSHEGSGLGLAITRRIIDMMGGEISVESEVGKGSSFRVTLPAGRTKGRKRKSGQRNSKPSETSRRENRVRSDKRRNAA
jgi:signal transduction histidine kinase